MGDHVGESQDRIITQAGLGVVPDTNNSETSATFTPMLDCVAGTTNCNTPQRWVVGYNDGAGNTLLGWAHSTDGVNWQTCNGGNLGCGGPSSKVATLNDYPVFMGDPTVVSDLRGHVVYINLASVDGTTATTGGVVALVSSDQGQHFNGPAIKVNSDPACSGGSQDQPDATFDFSTKDPTLWVSWRNRNAGVLPTYGACVRQFRVRELSAGVADLEPLDVSHTVEGEDRETSAHGQGGFRILAGEGIVTVVFQNQDFAGTPPGGTTQCPEPGGDQLVGAGFSSVTSYTGGAGWQPRQQLFHTDSQAICLNNDTVRNSIRPFAAARSPTPGQSTYYVAISAERNAIRLFASPSQGQTWNELDTSDPAHPFWAFPGVPVQQGAIVNGAGDLWFPAMAVDGQGRLGLSYYRGRNSDGQVDVRFRGNTAPFDPTVAWQPLFSQAAHVLDPLFTVPPVGNARGLGDYAGMATGTPTNTCGPAGVFLPAWTSGVSTKGPSDVDARVVNLSFP